MQDRAVLGSSIGDTRCAEHRTGGRRAPFAARPHEGGVVGLWRCGAGCGRGRCAARVAAAAARASAHVRLNCRAPVPLRSGASFPRSRDVTCSLQPALALAPLQATNSSIASAPCDAALASKFAAAPWLLPPNCSALPYQGAQPAMGVAGWGSARKLRAPFACVRTAALRCTAVCCHAQVTTGLRAILPSLDCMWMARCCPLPCAALADAACTAGSLAQSSCNPCPLVLLCDAGVHDFDTLLQLRGRPAGGYDKAIALLPFDTGADHYTQMAQNASEPSAAVPAAPPLSPAAPRALPAMPAFCYAPAFTDRACAALRGWAMLCRQPDGPLLPPAACLACSIFVGQAGRRG